MSDLDNAITGNLPWAIADRIDDCPKPDGATHFDTNYHTVCPWHKKINGEWAYWRDTTNSWKVYDDQDAATVNDFITV